MLIVGYSAAGVSAARVLSAHGVRTVVVDRASDVPYDRTLLSKVTPADDANLGGPLVAELPGVRVLLSQGLSALDVGNKRARTTEGRELRFQYVILATGARARIHPLLPPDGTNVFYLRDWADAVVLRSQIPRREKVAIVGGGLISLELTALFRSYGVSVDFICRRPPLAGFGAGIADATANILREAGVTVWFDEVVNVSNDSDRVVLETSSGVSRRVDAAVVAVGVVPNTEWLRELGFATTGFLHADKTARLKADWGAGSVFAAGDVAICEDRHSYLPRPGHWNSALYWGQAAALTILGEPLPKRMITATVFSSQYFGHTLQGLGQVGLPDGEAEIDVTSISLDTPMVGYGDRMRRLIGAAAYDAPARIVGLIGATLAGKPEGISQARIDTTWK